jgi:hypothetical protein
MAFWLFIIIEIGGRLGSCDWGKEVVSTLNRLIFASRFRSHVISRVTSEAVMYSASHVNNNIINCLCQCMAQTP